MKNSSKQIDRKTLKTLKPLNRLNPILLDELAAKSIVDEVPADKIICRHGEKDSRQIYLLSGQIEVTSPGETKTKVIKSKSPLTTAIAEGSPRTNTLKTKTASTLLYIDADLLELLMSDEPELNATYEVTEISADDNGDDWMLTFLQSPAFLQLPTENIQKLLTKLEELPVKKDQVVIQQGASDDNYYIIKSGSCNVHRQPYAGSANVLLATLPTGSGFGEEALISDGKRNATITMRENGTLMRLKKKDFLSLLINPLINYFELSETQTKLNEGCVVIDVRSEQESKEKPLDGAVNIPLSMLRMKLDSLNAGREYLLICNDSSQSAAAAFLMIQHGLKCSVLKGGLNSSKDKTKSQPAQKPAATDSSKQSIAAKKQTEQIAAQQQQIKAAREKSEQDIIKHKKELSESRARIAQKKSAQAANQATKQIEEKTNAAKQHAEEMMKKSAAIAEQTRKQAEQEAAQIKQQAFEEAERLRAEKAAQELAKAEAERKAIEQRQKEANEAMRQAKTMAAEAEQSRKQAEQEAERIKQRAQEEAEYLRAEVEAARQKMEQDAARLKEEEQIIKKSALKIKNEADEIRRDAVNEAQQVRSEIESTRALLNKKLQQTQDDEKRKHDAIIAEAQAQADKLAETKTKEAAAEAEAIRQKAKQDAVRLHNELEQTRKQIEAEATRVISDLKEQSKKAAAQEQEIQVIKEEVLVEVVSESEINLNTKPNEENVDYKSVSIPGMSPVEPLSDIDAKRKAEAIKAKLAQSQSNNISQATAANSAQTPTDMKVHKKNDKTILESEDELFIFKEPEIAAKTPVANKAEQQPTVSHRTQAESSLTQISIEAEQQQQSVVIYPKQEQETVHKNNPFLNQDQSPVSASSNGSVSAAVAPQFDKQAYMRKQNSKSNTLAIAASFILILAGAVFTLHATNTLKVQSIAALFNSGNDTVQPTTAIAKTKTIRKKVLRADTKVDIRKKVGNKMDNIMENWKEVLSDAENPKKSKNN